MSRVTPVRARRTIDTYPAFTFVFANKDTGEVVESENLPALLDFISGWTVLAWATGGKPVEIQTQIIKARDDG